MNCLRAERPRTSRTSREVRGERADVSGGIGFGSARGGIRVVRPRARPGDRVANAEPRELGRLDAGELVGDGGHLGDAARESVEPGRGRGRRGRVGVDRGGVSGGLCRSTRAGRGMVEEGLFAVVEARREGNELREVVEGARARVQGGHLRRGFGWGGRRRSGRERDESSR